MVADIQLGNEILVPREHHDQQEVGQQHKVDHVEDADEHIIEFQRVAVAHQGPRGLEELDQNDQQSRRQAEVKRRAYPARAKEQALQPAFQSRGFVWGGGPGRCGGGLVMHGAI